MSFFFQASLHAVLICSDLKSVPATWMITQTCFLSHCYNAECGGKCLKRIRKGISPELCYGLGCKCSPVCRVVLPEPPLPDRCSSKMKIPVSIFQVNIECDDVRHVKRYQYIAGLNNHIDDQAQDLLPKTGTPWNWMCCSNHKVGIL